MRKEEWGWGGVYTKVLDDILSTFGGWSTFWIC